MSWPAIVALLISTEIIVAIGDVAAKRWALGSLVSLAGCLALVCYVAVSMGWLVLLRCNGAQLGRSATLWAGTGVMIPVLVGRFYFGEPVSWSGWLGLVLTSAGLVLIQR